MYKSEQLALSLKHLIETGTWKPHEKLPSLRQQAEASGFSLITVMNAYQELEAQGLIYSKEKLGYFVAENPLQVALAKKVVLNEKIEINSLVFRYLKSIQSEKIVPLGSAFPNSQLLYSPKLMQTLAQQAKHRISYEQTPSLPPGNYELRKQIAQRYCMQGIPTDPSDIVITSGGLDALNLSLKAMTQAGDYILLQETIFYGAWQAAENLGLKVITIPEHPEHGLDLEAFKKAITTYPIKVCLLMLNSHNPIGFTVNEDIKFELAKLLHEHEIYLIEDDVYEELYYDQKKPLSMKYYDQQNLVLHCSSFSKTLGAGFRVGWVYAGKFSEHIQHVQLMSTISVNSFIQNALADYLTHRHYEKHLKSLRNTLKRLKNQYYQYLIKALPEDCQVSYYPSGYFLWITLPEHIDSSRIYEKLILNDIGVAPSILFYRKNKKQNHIRINCSFEMNDEMIKKLDILIAQISER
ncbi:PLP-dependent aminotransferase family protein [Acinetobacter tibetensis]|jgi:DNA-binding transcriptional MocR family regulator|uniref:PLP-dependent aminotransferase family protein n=1 Tax=Acinetobacter tibetensis TaxID=2943497 RepID=A0AAE9LNN5_9GAMM|nr:PLP-dependent aminotransferase family protein [Acinetobacter tibetensis]USE81835.1 PLP-dependent aminotransferase family protein [Acinetobacter tibetensis]